MAASSALVVAAPRALSLAPSSPRVPPVAPSTDGLQPILTGERAQRPVLGLWYPRQQGVIKGGDGRFFSPFLVGKAQICQNRDVLKLVFEGMNVVKRAMKAGEARVDESEEEEKKKKEEALAQELDLMTDAEKTVRLAEVKAQESAARKEKEDAAYEDAVNISKMQKFNTRIKLCVYLTRKVPKARMVDIEEAGVLLLFDKGADKFDGCLYTTAQGEGSWPYIEQGLLKIEDPFNFKGVCIVKRAKDPPATSEPVIYGFARLDMVPDRLKPSDSVLGMQEIKDLLAKATAPKAINAKAVVGFLGKALGIMAEEPPVDVSKLKANGFYVRQADTIWEFLKKSEEDAITFDEFKTALDHLEFYMLEPRAQRLFAACDLAKTGKITIIDFQIGLMMNDVIPPEQGLMPLDAFTLFDYKNEGEINQAQFREIASALGLQADEDRFEEVFKAADADGSGRIDYAEFKNIFVKLVKVDDELKKRNLDPGGILSSEEKNQERLRKVLDQEEADMLRAFAGARVLIEEQLTKRRIERDEKKRAIKAELVKLKRLEKLTAGYKKKQKSEVEKKMARERAKSKIEEKQLKAKLEQEEKDLKAKKEEEIRAQRRKKEEDRLAEVKARMLDRWDLRHNGFKEVPSWVYVGKEAENRLDVLVLLDLSENKLESIPEDGFLYWMNSLRYLNLSHNRIKRIPPEVRNCARLELLNMSNNYLTELPPEIGCLRELKQLDVFKNRLTGLPAELGNLTQLRILNIHSNLIYELPIELQELQEIVRLDLGDNKIRYLPEDLSKLMSCTDLDLSSNLINYLPATFGEHLFNLKFLDVSYNQLGELPVTMSRLGSLLTLKLKENQLRDLDSSLGGLTSLMELDACFNEVDYVSPAIGQCTALQSLKLNRNRIKSLPTEIEGLAHLQLLALHYNPLESILPQFEGLKSLQTLSLATCRLQGPLPDEFGLMDGLTHVDLSGNAITALPETIGNLTRLKDINASRNKIKVVPGTIRQCHSLVHVDLSSNRLERFPDFIADMPKLAHIDLSSNMIEFLPPNIYSMAKHLQFLGLEHNRLRAVPTEFSLLAHKVKVPVGKNPWHDLPQKWNTKWTPKQQTESPWGYMSWDVVSWATEEHLYYQACADEWKASGALHYTGRATLQDYLLGVSKRLDTEWCHRFVDGVTRIYFAAKEHGLMPRLHQLSEEETKYQEERVAASKVKREQQITLVRRLHDELKERISETYQEKQKAANNSTSLLRSRYLAAVSKFEARMEIKKREREKEREELMQVVSVRRGRQETRGKKKAVIEHKILDEEMGRLLAHAKKTPFW